MSLPPSLFSAATTAYGSSRARHRLQVSGATYVTAEAMLAPSSTALPWDFSLVFMKKKHLDKLAHS